MLYNDVSIWVVLIGLVVLAVGGPALARRANPLPWGEGVTATELAWGGGVALGGILGLWQLLAAF